MSVQQAAQAAVAVFPAGVRIATPRGTYSLRTVMVAIAGAESGWNPTEAGDYGLDSQYGLCQGASSWGLWQIHNVHAAYLQRVTGSSDPCAWAQWLFDPVHNAEAAYSVYRSQGLAAWTTWQTGAYLGFLEAAQAAVQAAEAASAPTTPSGSGGPAAAAGPASAGVLGGQPLALLGIGVAGLGLLALGVGLLWEDVVTWPAARAWMRRETEHLRARVRDSG